MAWIKKVYWHILWDIFVCCNENYNLKSFGLGKSMGNIKDRGGQKRMIRNRKKTGKVMLCLGMATILAVTTLFGGNLHTKVDVSADMETVSYDFHNNRKMMLQENWTTAYTYDRNKVGA